MIYTPTAPIEFEYTNLPQPPQPVEEWWWLKPDQMWGDIRACANPSLWDRLLMWLGIERATGCPAVVRFGTANNPEYSHSVVLTQEWQLFQADLLALAEYRRHRWELTPTEYDDIAQAWRSTYGPRRALTNVMDERQDYVSIPPQLDREPRVYDEIRGMETNSYQGVIEKNSHNQDVLKITAFDWASGPPTGYGLEILYHPCVQYGTIIYSGGAVGGWPQLVAQVPVPLIAKEPVYCLVYKFERYVGERREIGYIP